MTVLIGSILGFLGSIVPEAFKMFKQYSDDKQELLLLEKQMEFAKQNQKLKLQEINTNADIAESKALYKTYNTGIKWVDALNGTVRPIIAYSFFLLYVFIKIIQAVETPWALWTPTDEAIFAGVISFYFGRRSLEKSARF